MSDYTYSLPPELIAHEPITPRDSSRLLVYSTATDEVFIDTFSHLARYIPAHALMVLNDTRVVPARLECTKITGGTVRILFLFNEWDRKGPIRGLPDRGIKVGDTLYVRQRPIIRALSQHNEEFTFELVVSPSEFDGLCHNHGTTPLPPYIHSTLSEAESRTRYQTVFADKPASVAAPTASLHFTENVFQSLAEKGIDRTYVTLHVGRGTFAPVSEGALTSGRLHTEPISVSVESAQKICAARKDGRTIVAVGTTAMRSLESVQECIMQGKEYDGDTSLFIKPPYTFKVANALITNFHLANTSLLMLVDAFLQSKSAKRSWRDLYEIAIKEQFRFYSFGDAMLIV